MAQIPSDSDERPSRFRLNGWVQIALILVVIGVALFLARAPEQVEQVAAEVPTADYRPAVQVFQPEPTTQALTVNLTGSVYVKESATIISEVLGRVIWVSPKFDAGETLEAGEVFVEIDPEEYRLKVEAANISVREAEVELAGARDGGSAAALRKAELALEKAQNALELAELELRRTRISLPYRSRVVSSTVEVGETVGPASIVAPTVMLGTVYRDDSVQISAPIEQPDLRHLEGAVGHSARVHTGLGEFDAKVVRTSAIADQVTRLATLFLKFSDAHPPDSWPLPGSFAEISISGPEYEGAYVLPYSAEREGGHVWVVRNGALAQVKPHTLGRTDDGWIVEQFDAGSGVVLGPLAAANEGLAVQLAGAS